MDNIVVPSEPLPEWMIELAEQMKMIPAGMELPRGVIVGSARIVRCEEVASGQGFPARGIPVASKETRDGHSPATDHRPPATLFQWHLADVERIKSPRKPKRHPQPVWFKPF